MWAKILALLEKFIAKLGPKEVPKVAGTLSKLFRFSVPAEKAGIMAAIRRWMGNNPLKATAIVTALADAGYDAGSSALENIFSEHEDDLQANGGLDPLLAVIRDVKNRLAVHRESVVGDGDSGSIAGIKNDDAVQAAGAIKVQMDMIRLGAAHFGSVEAFKAVRDALLGVEDYAFDIYKMMRA